MSCAIFTLHVTWLGIVNTEVSSVCRCVLCVSFSLPPRLTDTGVHHQFLSTALISSASAAAPRRLKGSVPIDWMCVAQGPGLHNWPIVLHHVGEVPEQTMCARRHSWLSHFPEEEEEEEAAEQWMLCDSVQATYCVSEIYCMAVAWALNQQHVMWGQFALRKSNSPPTKELEKKIMFLTKNRLKCNVWSN